MKKVCIKGDGTEETGKRIIEYFVSFGGLNTGLNTGATVYYYYINDNIIVVDSEIPIDYELITLPESTPEKTFPREMLVWDENESRAIKYWVKGVFEGRYVVMAYPNNPDCNWVVFNYAKEIEPPKPLTTDEKIANLQKQIDELKQQIR